MVFNSIQFALFFPIVIVLYLIIPFKVRWLWLLFANYFFYMFWNLKYGILLGIVTIASYFFAMIIDKSSELEDNKYKNIKKNFFILLSFAIILGLLFFFKYFNFFTDIINLVFSKLNIAWKKPHYDILLPIGISFYTFQSLSYIIDVFRGDIKAERNFIKYAVYISFFPKLLAGPITKAKDILPKFEVNHKFHYEPVKRGLLLMLWGFFQKLIIADRLVILVDAVYDNPTSYEGFEVILATVFFAFQIYCDFAAYSDIARGASLIMGIEIVKNFNSPYFAKSIQDFWRRWHISLTSWFRDYLYIPLGGNRKGTIKKHLNIIIVFLVSGLWHGAGLTFLIWGALHGLYQVIGMIIKPARTYFINKLNIKNEVFSYKLVQGIITFILVDFAWIFFRATSFHGALLIIKKLFIFNPWIFFDGSIYNMGLDQKDFNIAIFSILILIIVDLIRQKQSLFKKISEQNIVFRWSLYFIAIFSILIFGVYGPGYNSIGYLYFQF